MSDQKEIETKRYARRTIKISGLAAVDENGLPADALKLMSQYGVHWNLHGKFELEPKTVTTVKSFVAGKEIPRGFTMKEVEWIMELAQENGLDTGKVETTEELQPIVPYIDAPILIHDPDGEGWVKDFHIPNNPDTDVEVSITLARYSKLMTIVIEGDSKSSVSNSEVDAWVQEKIDLIRASLQHAGFIETELEIDCEVIMGAEREAKCDPEFMRSLLADNNAEVEEE